MTEYQAGSEEYCKMHCAKEMTPIDIIKIFKLRTYNSMIDNLGNYITLKCLGAMTVVCSYLTRYEVKNFQ